MPPINKYKCNKCGFSLPIGWGGYVYIENDKGKRESIPHPLEMNIFFKRPSRISRIKLFFGIGISKENIQRIKEIDRAGFNSDCVCFDCLKQFELDIGDAEEARSSWRYFYGAVKRNDERKCPYCSSRNVKTVFELIGNICPKCKDGIIEEIETGHVC